MENNNKTEIESMICSFLVLTPCTIDLSGWLYLTYYPIWYTQSDILLYGPV